MEEYCITGDETGLLKLIDLSANVCSVSGVQDRAGGILCLSHISSWNSEPSNDSWLFALARRNGALEAWRCHRESSLEQVASTQLPHTPGEVSYQLTSFGENGILCADHQGTVSVHRLAEVRSSSTSLSWKTETSFSVRGPISACRISTQGADNIAAFGGRENDLTLYDLQTQQGKQLASRPKFILTDDLAKHC